MINVMLIASAKSQSATEASHQPDYMANCLTISHTCLPCLPSEKALLFWRHLFVVGREVSLESWESNVLGRWEKCIGGVRWHGGKGGRIVR